MERKIQDRSTIIKQKPAQGYSSLDPETQGRRSALIDDSYGAPDILDNQTQRYGRSLFDAQLREQLFLHSHYFLPLPPKQILQTAYGKAKSTLTSSPSGPWAMLPQGSRSQHPVRSEIPTAVKLFFKPLNKRASRDDVHSLLSKLGSVSFLRVPFSQKKGKNLGYGFVIYESRDLAFQLINKTISVELQGKILNFERFDFLKLSPEYFQKMDSIPGREDSRMKPKIDQDGCKARVGRPLSHHFKPTTVQYFEAYPRSLDGMQTSELRFNVLSPDSGSRVRLSFT